VDYFLPGADDQDLLTIVEVSMREREEVIGKEKAWHCLSGAS
jgi:hypothetical protein